MKGKMRLFFLMAGVLGALLLAACGGGSSDGVSQTGSGSMVSGSVVKGPVYGATVTAREVRPDGTPGGTVGTAVTDSSGTFTMHIGDYQGPLYLEATGGRYMDEATAGEMPLLTNTPLYAAIPFMGQGTNLQNVQITALTAMATFRAEGMGGLSTQNIEQANAAVGRYFDVDDILATHPMNPLIANSVDSAAPGERNYGMGLAAMSQYANEEGLENSCIATYAFSEDASDGFMNGMMWNDEIGMGPWGGTTASGMMMGGPMMHTDAGTAGLADAMGNFINSEHNLSGVTVDQMNEVMEQLRNSSGQLY
ncbi:MAG: hypothetical protein P8Y75_07110 [Nitrospirota bacterium]